MLKLLVMGSPQLTLDGKALGSGVHGKLLALMVYLAVSRVRHTRVALADLLWSEMSSTLARKNLRGALYQLRQLLGPHLVVTRQDAIFNQTSPHWFDVEVLRAHVTADFVRTNPKGFREALHLYRGEFLAGFEVSNAPVFEEWMVNQRVQLHNFVVQGWHLLVDHALQSGDDALGLDATNHLLALDAVHEAAHRQRMLLLARTGQPGAALAQYAICQRALATELALTPSPATTTLYEQIKAGAFAGESLLGCSPSDRETTLRLLPVDGALRVATGKQREGDGHAPAHMPLEKRAVDWRSIPPVPQFFGRQPDLTRLNMWLLVERCRVVGVFGLAGQGKTMFIAHWVRLLQTRDTSSPPQHRHYPAEAGWSVTFERVLWHSCTTSTSLSALVQTWLASLSEQPTSELALTWPQLMTRLLHQLQQQRCLLVLDNVEAILQSGTHSGHYCADYGAFGTFLQQIATSEHSSTLLVIGRTRPPEFNRLEEHPIVRSLHLDGLAIEAAKELLQANGLQSTPAAYQALHACYQGHALGLVLAAETIVDLFGGEWRSFLQTEAPIFDQLRHLFDQQYIALSALEQEILAWLALEPHPMTALALWQCLLQPQSYTTFLEALRSLLRHSLVENQQTGLALPKLFQDYLIQGLWESLYLDGQTTTASQGGGAAECQLGMGAPVQFRTTCQRLFNRLSKDELRTRLPAVRASPTLLEFKRCYLHN